MSQAERSGSRGDTRPAKKTSMKNQDDRAQSHGKQASRNNSKGRESHKDVISSMAITTSSMDKQHDDIVSQPTDCTDELICTACDTLYTKDDDKLIECERCERWICLDCSGMSEEHYNLLNDSKYGEFLHWFCQQCNQQAMKDWKTGNAIEIKCKEYMTKFKSEITEELRGELQKVEETLEMRISDEIQKVNVRIDGLESERKQATAGDSEEKTEEEVEKFLEEVRDREARKHNLVIFNLKESDATDGEERKNFDSECVRKLLSSIGAAVPFSSVTRLGKRGDNTVARPVRITTASTDDKHRVLKAAVKLKDLEDYSRVYVNRDQTPLEQRQWKKLLEERKRKMQESSNVPWVIRRGRVIKGRQKKE